LKWHDNATYLGKDKILTLGNGLKVTYGQICALGGDFFGPDEPICFGKNLADQVTRFEAGFKTMNEGTSGKSYAESVISQRTAEAQAVEDAFKSNSTAKEYYDSFKAQYLQDLFSAAVGWMSSQKKGYLGLALINLDHFGQDARAAYNAGHTAALQKAAKSKAPKDLEDAYALNAFADHFLQDSFAAGHLRVPRRTLHASGDKRFDRDICSQYMHSEDNTLGLKVKNPRGESWTAYGDSKLADKENEENLKKCFAALAVSAEEVFQAWKTGKVPAPSSYGAWQHAPTLESAFESVNHPPMFNRDGCPRTNVLDTNCKTYVDPKDNSWSYPKTLLNLKGWGGWLENWL